MELSSNQHIYPTKGYTFLNLWLQLTCLQFCGVFFWWHLKEYNIRLVDCADMVYCVTACDVLAYGMTTYN